MKTATDSLKEYARGIAGGLLFSLPIIYTMEVWQAGLTLQPYELFIYIAFTFVLLLGYNRYAGLHPAAHWKEVVIDSIEEMGIGLLLSFIMLLTLGLIKLTDMNVDEVMGKVIVESMTVAIGVSVGTAQLGSETGEELSSKNKPDPVKTRRPGGDLAGKAVLALCGSILIAGNIAPTEEVRVIAVESQNISVLFMAIESLLLGALILFFSDFKGTKKIKAGTTIFTIISDTCMAYVIALASSAFMLWFFGMFGEMAFSTCINHTVVLGFPSMLGASAGRLLIK